MPRAAKVSKRSRSRPTKTSLKRGRVKKTQLVKGVSGRDRKAMIKSKGRVAARPSTPPVQVPSVSSAIPLPASSLEQETKTVTREPEPC